MANADHLELLQQGVSAWNDWRMREFSVTPDLSGANLSGKNLIGANFIKADLSRANLAGADLDGANLSAANLNSAHVHMANLRMADLGGATLARANLVEANLSSAHLSGANLARANLRRANLVEANLFTADLRKADLVEAQLDRADLTGAKLLETRRSNWSIKRVTCRFAFWDSEGKERTKFGQGEFERIFAETQRAVPPDRKPPRKPVPRQVDAPIIPGIADHKLIRKPGRAIPKTAPVAGLSQYLASQYKAVVAELEGANTDRRIVAVFREAEALLQDWTIANLLAFGAHLELVQSCTGLLKQELSDPVAHRVDAVVRNSRQFINSFEEWHAYAKMSVLFAVEVEDRGDEIVGIVKDAARDLAQEPESVDPGIPSSLDEFAETASRKESRQGVAIGIMSALRSMKNISIIFVEYAAKAAQTGFAYLAKNDRALKLIKAICRFQPHAVRLSALYPELAWLLNHEELLRALCNVMGQEKKA